MTETHSAMVRSRAIAKVRERIELNPTKGDWMVCDLDIERAVLRFVHERDAKEYAALTGFVALPLTPEVAAEDWSWRYACPRCGFVHIGVADQAACSRREDREDAQMETDLYWAKGGYAR